MNKTKWRFALETAPGFSLEDPIDFVDLRQRTEEALDKAEATDAAIVNEFQRGDIGAVGAHLAVADNPIPGELKPGYSELCEFHANRQPPFCDISDDAVDRSHD
jgi:hypothetical protein